MNSVTMCWKNEDVHGIVRDMMDRVVESVVMANVDASKHNEVDYESVIQGLEMLGVTPEQNIKVEEIRGKSSDETASYCARKVIPAVWW